jgi:hypothetical protein
MWEPVDGLYGSVAPTTFGKRGRRCCNVLDPEHDASRGGDDKETARAPPDRRQCDLYV